MTADWRARRIILVGQAPGPTGPPPGRPLVGSRSGTHLQMLASCATLKEYIRRFETRNVLDAYPGRAPGGKGDRFPMREARAAAKKMEPSFRGRKVVFIGTATASAFHQYEDAIPFLWYHGSDDNAQRFYEWAFIPHPSPVNRLWNDPANVARAKAFFDQLRGDQDVNENSKRLDLPRPPGSEGFRAPRP